jgi:hypothetical protein
VNEPRFGGAFFGAPNMARKANMKKSISTVDVPGTSDRYK